MKGLKLCLAILVSAVSAWTAAGGSYSLNGLTWQDGYSPGEWGSDFAGAKAYAKSFNIPLVAVAGRTTCGYCASFERMVATDQVKKWAKERGYLFTISLCDANTSAATDYGTSSSNWSAARSFAQTGTKLPFVGVWWPRDKSGKEVRVKFNGRSGYMPVTSGSLAQQFMDSVDHLVGDYAGVAPKTVTVTFKGNGGTPTTSDRILPLNSTLGALPTVTRTNYLFDGWFTSATDGEPVTSATKVTEAAIYFAHWLKAVTLKTTVSPSAAGTVTGAGTFRENSSVTLKATPKSGYVFSWWKKGTTKLSQEPTYTYALGTSGVTLTAVFITSENDSVTLESNPASEYERNVAIRPIAIATTSGSRVTLKASGLPPGLSLKDGEIVGTPKKSGRYTFKLTATTAAKKIETKTFSILVRAANERVVGVSCDATEGKVSGGGLIADGKKTTVKATPAKGYAFEGWYDGSTRLSQQASLAYVADGRDVTLVAKFVTVADDLKSIALKLDEVRQEAAVVTTNRVQQGLKLRWPLAVAALTPSKVTVSGLPSGLKLEKTLVDKAEKLYSYALVGVPSSASKDNAKTGLAKPTVAKIKVSTGAKNTVTYAEAFVVEPLPTWAYGTFAGASARNAEGEGVGVAKLTITAAGKASGAFPVAATNGTLSVNGYESLTASEATLVGEVKYGKRAYPMTLTVKSGESSADVTSGNGRLPISCSCAAVDQPDLVATLYRNFWKDRLDLPSPKLAKTSLANWGYPELYLTVSAAGQATFAGKLSDGTRVSSSAPVHFNVKGERCAFLIVPFTKKYAGCFDEVAWGRVEE